jgi:hypothetical protein
MIRLVGHVALAWIGAATAGLACWAAGIELAGLLHRRRMRRISGPTGSQQRDRTSR